MGPLSWPTRRRLDYYPGPGANYHGYAIQDFLGGDPRIGTREDLQELVRQAHARGIYVILDIVINHTGDNWAYPGDYLYYSWKDVPAPFDYGFRRKTDLAAELQADDAVWLLEFQAPRATGEGARFGTGMTRGKPSAAIFSASKNWI